MIDFEHVSKEYKKGGRLALEDINFHVDEGAFVFLLYIYLIVKEGSHVCPQ